jgi:hypothetical protein
VVRFIFFAFERSALRIGAIATHPPRLCWSFLVLL